MTAMTSTKRAGHTKPWEIKGFKEKPIVLLVVIQKIHGT